MRRSGFMGRVVGRGLGFMGGGGSEVGRVGARASVGVVVEAVAQVAVSLTRRIARATSGGRFGFRAAPGTFCGSNSVVECHLAKVDVEGSNPFSRSGKQ